jgi:5-methylcytosine-specific restriction endonuclease McrA
MPHKSCLNCGKPFYTENRGAKYCSRDCYSAVTGRPDAHNRTCVVCGKVYSAYDKGSKYCSQGCYNSTRRIGLQTCPTCGKTFTPYRQRKTYCSHKCVNHKLTDCECAYCGRTFHPRTASKSKFCSLDCYHASLASEYPRSRLNFTSKEKRAIMERDGHRCVKCGATESLEVDHVLALCNGGTRSIENGQTLCVACHDEKTRHDKALARARLLTERD